MKHSAIWNGRNLAEPDENERSPPATTEGISAFHTNFLDGGRYWI